MPFTDAQIRALLEEPSRHPPCARHLGFELIDFSVEDGWAEVAFAPRPEFANPAGRCRAASCAPCWTRRWVSASISRRFEIIVPTLQISVSYLRPTPIARVVARGEVLRFSQASVAMQGALRLPDGTLLAVAMATAVPRPFPA